MTTTKVDREKVIKALDVCLKNIDQPDCPNDCPYLSNCSKYENRVVFQPLMRDVLLLLKEQENHSIDAVPISYIRKWIENHPTDYTTVESMITDWREEGEQK